MLQAFFAGFFAAFFCGSTKMAAPHEK